MNSLEFSIKQLTAMNHDGSHATQANRHVGLFAMAEELRALGFGLKSIHNLKPPHVTALVGAWKGAGITDATIRNRLGWLRWAAVRIGKPGLLPRDNDAFGLAERTPYQGNRAREADATTLARLKHEHVRLALRLEREFGLRREEALKLRPAEADRGDCIQLRSSWCKGGRARAVPITSPSQRQLLDDVRRATGTGSLVPLGRTFRQYLQVYKYDTRQAGLGQAHGLRHSYARDRYLALAGWACPANGGPTAERMTAAQRQTDYDTRLQISLELGHGRIDVTDTYLGRRWAGGHHTRAAA